MLFGKRERLIQRILIVEDEPLVAFDTEHMLGEAGYEVAATVDNLEAARAVIENQALDLVLTDIRLRSDGDGTDVARTARARGIPVLFVSAHCSDEARKLAIGCLAKPYSERGLKSALEALDRHLRGEKLKKVPAQLTFYANPEPIAPAKTGPPRSEV
jgi:DNA-binding response OmpR family regulator